MLGLLSADVFSQATTITRATTTATIGKAHNLSKSINTDVCTLAIILTAYVKLAPIGTPSKEGGIILPVTSGTFTAAIYDYSGGAGEVYTFSYPAAPFIVNTGSEAMKVETFTSDPARNKASGLIAGIYVSVTPANVTVNYN